jgi:hemolysin III
MISKFDFFRPRWIRLWQNSKDRFYFFYLRISMTNIQNRKFIIEEIINSITHGIGLALSLAGLSVLVVFASLYGNAWHIVSSSIFGASLVLLYTFSTLYHSFQLPRIKHIFKILDHSSIYLLIAGTYTPFTLVNLRGAWGWTLFGLIWGLAIFGILFSIIFINRFKIVSTFIYLFMGWLVIIAIKPLLSNVPGGGIAWLVAGGLFYTIGVIFYALKKLPFSHAVWHVFVLGGSVCHFFAVMFYVVPME